MARRRTHTGVTVVRPGETPALRAWARDAGLFAVMIDQVPGEPEEELSLMAGRVTVPWPARLLRWIASRDPELLAVSVRWESPHGIVFRYDRVEPQAVKEGIARLMNDAIARAPEQYNWSYGKARVQQYNNRAIEQ
jgi:hypothetical protein